MDSASEKSTKDGSHPARIVKLQDVDVAAELDSDKPLDPEVAARLRCAYIHTFCFKPALKSINLQTEDRLAPHASDVS